MSRVAALRKPRDLDESFRWLSRQGVVLHRQMPGLSLAEVFSRLG
jgi:hypothetical protein